MNLCHWENFIYRAIISQPCHQNCLQMYLINCNWACLTQIKVVCCGTAPLCAGWRRPKWMTTGSTAPAGMDLLNFSVGTSPCVLKEWSGTYFHVVIRVGRFSFSEAICAGLSWMTTFVSERPKIKDDLDRPVRLSDVLHRNLAEKFKLTKDVSSSIFYTAIAVDTTSLFLGISLQGRFNRFYKFKHRFLVAEENPITCSPAGMPTSSWNNGLCDGSGAQLMAKCSTDILCQSKIWYFDRKILIQSESTRKEYWMSNCPELQIKPCQRGWKSYFKLQAISGSQITVNKIVFLQHSFCDVKGKSDQLWYHCVFLKTNSEIRMKKDCSHNVRKFCYFFRQCTNTLLSFHKYFFRSSLVMRGRSTQDLLLTFQQLTTHWFVWTASWSEPPAENPQLPDCWVGFLFEFCRNGLWICHSSTCCPQPRHRGSFLVKGNKTSTPLMTANDLQMFINSKATPFEIVVTAVTSESVMSEAHATSSWRQKEGSANWKRSHGCALNEDVGSHHVRCFTQQMFMFK